ncbi:hypothetical protein OTB20_38990 [Streptomyces sp. H27-H1]|uniref:hypothetical protein n=1 Tax=Streptomyces sp. H27-H1 TaxID=2996461 RepID=UPI002270498C|nr:hypothetical protein [Streptomyces sp. H27-H1]MCY0932056.1 hypothetical protein [Streptomyces sp. H27-H1]
MLRSPRLKKSAVVLCTTLTLMTGASVTATADEIKNHCGGEFPDYFTKSGGLQLDAAFKGTAGKEALPLVLTPKSTEGRLRAEYTNGTNYRAAISMAMVKVDALGNGQLNFETFSGNAWTTSLVCAPGQSRVTKMVGMMEIASTTETGSVDTVEFTVSRT